MKIVWFSEIKWDYLRTRKQQIIGRKPPDVEILYLEPYVKGRKNRFDLRREGDLFVATVPFIKSAPGTVWRRLLDTGAGRSVMEAGIRFRVGQLLRNLRFKGEETGFIISNIYAVDAATRLDSKFLLYDCNDSHDAFPGMPPWTTDYFLRTCARSDAVYASSRELLKRVMSARGGKGCAYLGNGVDYGHFEAGEQVLHERISSGRVRLGYVGAIAPWLDFEMLTALAGRHPEWEIVLAGPVLLGVEDKVAALTALPNVRRLEPVPYERVPELLGSLTVGLIPFRFDDLTRGVNPNKLYEYMASGLPVAATAFSQEVLLYPEAVRAADGEAEFLRACEEIVAGLSDRVAALGRAREAQNAAKRHDWRMIADIFWSGVNDLMIKGTLSDSL